MVVAALNGFFDSPPTREIWMITGPEFESEEGETPILVDVKALFQLKSVSFCSFQSYMAKKWHQWDFNR